VNPNATMPCSSRLGNRVNNELRLNSLDAERDLLDRMSKPHSDPQRVRACKEVLAQIGTEPAAA